MKEKYDVIIIGSGLGGLVSANILARHGFSVCVLEKNNQFGGNLQTFVRDKQIFDTGVHYIGGLDKGQNLYNYFTYLDIMKDLKLQKLDEDKFDVITFGNQEKEYNHAQGYENFENSLIKEFPEEEKAIKEYCEKIIDTCNLFPLYNLELADDSGYDFSIFNLNTIEYLDSITDNELLKAVLSGSNFLYAGQKETPFYVHALSVNSYIQSSYRVINGGGSISKLLVKKLREFGGEIYRHTEVVKINYENEKAESVVTKNNQTISADLIISNIEPKVTIKLLDYQGLRKSYIKRIQNLKSIISGFSIYLVFKPNTFKYLNYNYYHFKDSNNIWKAQEYTQESWPEGYMISMGTRKNDSEFAESMVAMTYMRFEEVEEWENTFNTVAEASDRGSAYETFKAQKTEQFLTEIEQKFPNIREQIASIHSSTPLSYRDYIGNNKGTIYGYVKDTNNPMYSFLSPNTRIKNLFFTGQSLNMHGVLGVTISAVLTCSQIIGKEKLLQSIKESLPE